MSDYVPHSPAFAEKEHRWQLTEEELARRLDNASPGQLRQIWHDEDEPMRVRNSALARLVWACPDDPEVTQVLLEMLGAPDPHLRLRALSMQITCDVRWSDPRLMQKACSLLDDPDGQVAGLAATLLAVRWHHPILPQLRTWLQGDEQARRRIAMSTLRFMNTPDARGILREEWEQSSRGEEDRVLLAQDLLWMGDPCGVPFLESVALRANSLMSAAAALAMCESADRRAKGLQLLRWVLDNGSLEAKRAIVLQIYYDTRGGLTHAFTADALHEARCWIDQQMEEAEKRKSQKEAIIPEPSPRKPKVVDHQGLSDESRSRQQRPTMANLAMAKKFTASFS